MEIINNIFNETIAKYNSPRFIVQMIIDSKLKNIGLHLNERQLELLSEQLIDENINNYSIKVSNRQQRRTKLSERELEKKFKKIIESLGADIEKYQKDYPETLKSFIEDSSKEIAIDLLVQLQKDYNKKIKYERRQEQNDQKSIEKIWRDAFYYADILKYIVEDIVLDYTDRKDIEGTYKNNIVINFISRGYTLFSEIYILIKSGYPDGAFSLWRSLYEITIISEFITMNNEETSKMYFYHHNIQIFKNLNLQIQDGYEIDKSEYKEIEKIYNELLLEYGERYKYNYGWANEALSMKKPVFKDIEKAVESNNFQTYFNLASNKIHSNSQGLYYKSGLGEINEYILLDTPSYQGLGEILDLNSKSIFILTINALLNINEDTNYDSIVLMKLLGLVYEKIKDNILVIEEEIEENTRP